MKNYILGFLSVFMISTASAQQAKTVASFKKDHKKAVEMWLYDFNYMGALPIFEGLLSQDPTNAYLKFAVGDCYLHHPTQKTKALEYLHSAADSITPSMEDYKFEDYKTRLAPFGAYRMLGIAYRYNYQFDSGIAYLNKYKELLGDNITEAQTKEIEREIQMCKTGKLLVKYPVEIEVNNLGGVINGRHPDYAPVLSADEKTLIFTSRRGSEGDPTDPNDFMFYEQIYITEKDEKGKWGKPKSISSNINEPGSHQATVGLSVDGQQLLIYSAKDNPNGDIYYTKLDGSEWVKPIPFDAINSKASEVDACFNVDGTAIYFSSNRKGGYGGFDIYKITKLPNGNWSFPQNLGPEINTAFDDRAPYIHPDGVTLFFASNGHETMGGLDIFQTVQDEQGKWMKPENIGYPINTTDDDVFYVTTVDGKRSYYSSYKIDGFGEKDIYMLDILTQTEEKALTVMTGEFTIGDKNGTVPDNAQIIVTDNETGDIVGIYMPNKKTGKYLFILPPGKNYNVTYEAEGYLFKSENLLVPKNSSYSMLKKEIKLAPIKANQSIVLNNVFFEFDSEKLTADSKTELEKLFKLLEINSTIRVEISGHTDSKGTKAYNMKLSKSRAESVKEYLVKKGINANRIEAVGYGPSQPIAKNTNDDGTDNPEGRQLNRRIELKILTDDGSMDDVVNKIAVPDQLKKK
jgi:outer membrane protein OmpA-like peptidoglycan-associated protein